MSGEVVETLERVKEWAKSMKRTWENSSCTTSKGVWRAEAKQSALCYQVMIERLDLEISGIGKSGTEQDGGLQSGGGLSGMDGREALERLRRKMLGRIEMWRRNLSGDFGDEVAEESRMAIKYFTAAVSMIWNAIHEIDTGEGSQEYLLKIAMGMWSGKSGTDPKDHFPGERG